MLDTSTVRAKVFLCQACLTVRSDDGQKPYVLGAAGYRPHMRRLMRELSPGRWLARGSANVDGAIFGTITAAAVIAASAAHDATIGSVVSVTIVTVVVFWLAHVYGSVVESHMEEGRADLNAVGEAMIDELPVLEAPAPSVLVLLLGLIGVFKAETAVLAALWMAVAQLVIWGAAAARRHRRSWRTAAVSGAISGSFGLVIILLKALVH